MDINELPSPQFVINEAGMISVFLPAFEGEPATPVLSKKMIRRYIFNVQQTGIFC